MCRITVFSLTVALAACAAPPKPPAQPPTPTHAAVAPKFTIPDLIAPRDTPAALDPKHPLHIGQEYYPIASRRLGEEGTCVLRLQVDADGIIRATQLLTSTGFARLNAACLSSTIDGRLIPATVGGKPVASWFLFRVNWRLSGLNGSFLNLMPRIRDDYYLKVGPDYHPAVSRKLHQEGDCIVHVTVDADGPPSTVTLTKSTGYEPLDQACITAVQQAQFIAARQDPGIVSASTDIDITWRLPAVTSGRPQIPRPIEPFTPRRSFLSVDWAILQSRRTYEEGQGERDRDSMRDRRCSTARCTGACHR